MNTQVARDNFENYLKDKASLYFKEKNALNDSILYSLMASGKRVRPLLTIGFSQGFQGEHKFAMVSAMTIEMIHSYSLIHDDLPAMDNDDFRRGKPTNHKVYGEAMAILAGDSLLTFAPQFLLTELSALKVDSSKILQLLKELLTASGHVGMVKGQALDMKFENENHSHFDQNHLETTLKDIHELKTGSIITWSCLAGLYSHPDEQFIKTNHQTVMRIGNKIGLFFQMVDDVLDVTSELQELGKTPGKDQKAGKLTYTHLFGLEKTVLKARELVKDLQADVNGLGQKENWQIIREIIKSLEGKLPS
jgi:geranylgeranyl diphosphate synthase, type II